MRVRTMARLAENADDIRTARGTKQSTGPRIMLMAHFPTHFIMSCREGMLQSPVGVLSIIAQGNPGAAQAYLPLMPRGAGLSHKAHSAPFAELLITCCLGTIVTAYTMGKYVRGSTAGYVVVCGLYPASLRYHGVQRAFVLALTGHRILLVHDGLLKVGQRNVTLQMILAESSQGTTVHVRQHVVHEDMITIIIDIQRTAQLSYSGVNGIFLG